MARMLKLAGIAAALMVLACAGGAAAESKEKGKVEPPCVGIDLGTTYSVVGVWQGGNVEIIPNEMGNRITPSVVAFTESERLVGDGAKNQIAENPDNTVYTVKRLIGRKYTDKTVQADKKLLSFAVVGDKEGNPRVQVQYKGETKTYTPEEVSAMVLQKMKEIAETFIGKPVKNAVVTVPAYFNDAQRQSTKDAGTIAGLNVVRIINEPTAAAIAYGLDKSGEKNILVFDLGGGTFDVSLLTIDEGFFEVVATNGDTHLGGEDFDNRMMKHFVDMLKKKKKVDISKDQGALARLRKACEAAKRQLSSQLEVRVEVDNLQEGFDFSEKLTRAKFEELNADLFKRTLAPVQRVLEDGKLEKSDVDEIVLVGGSTRIPKVQQLIKDFFNGKEPNRGINPDEAVAFGAAVQAAVLTGEQELGGKVVLVDVVPLSLGVEVPGVGVKFGVPRNSQIPSRRTIAVIVPAGGQTLTVVEGERLVPGANRNIGELRFVKPVVRSTILSLTFDVDENSIFTVSCDADDKALCPPPLVFGNDRGRLSEEEIERMVREAQEFEEEDRKMRENVEARNSFEAVAYQLKSQLGDKEKLGGKLSEGDKETVEAAVKEALAWLDEHPDAEQDDVLERLSELCAALHPAAQSVCEAGDASGSHLSGTEAESTTTLMWDDASGEAAADSHAGGARRPASSHPRVRRNFNPTVGFPLAPVVTDARGVAEFTARMSDATSHFTARVDVVAPDAAAGADHAIVSVMPLAAAFAPPHALAPGDVAAVPVTVTVARELRPFMPAGGLPVRVRVEADQPSLAPLAAVPLLVTPAEAECVAAAGTGRCTATVRLEYAAAAAAGLAHMTLDEATARLRVVASAAVPGAAGADFTDALQRSVVLLRQRPAASGALYRHVLAASGVLTAGGGGDGGAGSAGGRVTLLIPRAHFDGATPPRFDVDVTVAASPLASIVESLSHLVREPYGCFEQSASTTYPNVLLARLIDAAYPQLVPAAGANAGAVPPAAAVADDPALQRASRLRAAAVANMRAGYRRMLRYETSQPGGFEWFGELPAHEALTSYGALLFADMAAVAVPGADAAVVEAALLNRTLRWLAARRDSAGGFSRSAGNTWDDYGKAAAHVTDAYIVWSIGEAQRAAAHANGSAAGAAEWPDLSTELDAMAARAAQTDGAAMSNYERAVAASAFLRFGRLGDAAACLRRLAAAQRADGAIPSEGRSITMSAGRTLEIETTAIASVAAQQLAASGGTAAGDDDDVSATMRRLHSRALAWVLANNRDGRYGSTQSTVLALRAIVAAFARGTPAPPPDADGAAAVPHRHALVARGGTEHTFGQPTVRLDVAAAAPQGTAAAAVATAGMPALGSSDAARLRAAGVAVQRSLHEDRLEVTLELRTTEGYLEADAVAAFLPFAAQLSFESAVPPAPARAIESLRVAFAGGANATTSAAFAQGDVATVRVDALQAAAERPGAAQQGMLVAVVPVPAGFEVRLEALRALVARGACSFVEVIGTGTQVALYWRSQLPAHPSLPGRRGVRVDIPVVAAVPGVYRAPPSQAYLYYDDDFRATSPGLRAEIQAPAGGEGGAAGGNSHN